MCQLFVRIETVSSPSRTSANRRTRSIYRWEYRRISQRIRQWKYDDFQRGQQYLSTTVALPVDIVSLGDNREAQHASTSVEETQNCSSEFRSRRCQTHFVHFVDRFISRGDVSDLQRRTSGGFDASEREILLSDPFNAISVQFMWLCCRIKRRSWCTSISTCL